MQRRRRDDHEHLLLAGRPRPLRAASTSATSTSRRAARSAAASSRWRRTASSMRPRTTRSWSPPGTRAPARSWSRSTSARAARSTPTSTSSSSSTRSATGCRHRRTTRRRTKAWSNFPKVRIGDDVRAQHRLLTEKFGMNSLALVVGGSMGAQQTYEWAVRYPDMVQARRTDRRHREEHRARLPLHRDAERGDHVGPGAGTAATTRSRPTSRRPEAPRQDVGGDGLEHRVLQAGPARGAGLFDAAASSSTTS